MKNAVKISLKVIKWFLITIFLSVLVFLISIPIVNDFSARHAASEIAALPLPQNTRIVERVSRADKLVGSGNGMQFFGAVLLESDLSLEELENHYAAYRKEDWQYIVEVQNTQKISVIEHGSLSFKTDVSNGNFYIVYSWGDGISPFQDFDLRGH